MAGGDVRSGWDEEVKSMLVVMGKYSRTSMA